MHENHQHEQYFFAPPTIERLTALLRAYPSPCCLGAPTVARQHGAATLLDIDPRFSDAPGFVRWDMYRPRPLDTRFGAILCDPPFNRVSLSQLFAALRVLCRGDFSAPLFLCHLQRRQHDIQGTLGAFGLAPTDLALEYVTVKPQPGEEIILYANVPLG